MRFLTAQPYCVYFNGPLEPGGRGGAMPSNYFDIIKTPMDYAKINDKLVSVRVEKERAHLAEQPARHRPDPPGERRVPRRKSLRR